MTNTCPKCRLTYKKKYNPCPGCEMLAYTGPLRSFPTPEDIKAMRAKPKKNHPRIKVPHRFWGVLSPKGWVVPSSVSYHRSLAIKRFLKNEHHDNWRWSKRHGWKLARLIVVKAP